MKPLDSCVPTSENRENEENRTFTTILYHTHCNNKGLIDYTSITFPIKGKMNSWERNSEGLGPMHSKSKTHGKNQAFCWLHNDIHLTNVTQSSNYVQSKGEKD